MLSQLKQIQRLGARLLLGGACLSILWSMFWALNYALSNYLGQSWVSIPQMGWRHGLFNVLGYALPALLALCWEHPPARHLIRPIPFSQLFARQHVGAEFFRQKSPQTPPSKRPTGLIEDFSRYARADFNDEALPLKLRHFYEHSEDYGLRVIPEWQWGFQRAGRLFRKVMDKIGQMALPVEAERLDEAIESKILPVDDTLDGRQGVRAWVRTYKDSGHVVYAAAYSQHKQGEHCYMNIAFPLPWSQMSSILRLDLLKTQASRPALKLSSLPQQGHYGDQGVYWVFPWFTLRLPINETIEVWTCEQARDWPHEIPAGSQLLAQHDMWICGLHCLRLYYSIFPEKPTELKNKLSA